MVADRKRRLAAGLKGGETEKPSDIKSLIDLKLRVRRLIGYMFFNDGVASPYAAEVARSHFGRGL
jgi:hypothetical protein